ncbi:hypothetical protein A9Q99_13845 [Gammaproteobacteria bacterium 45_16_T64]|nr:hypothetical protein A9Q99_13845 [Gammaproteobacteria bacterium 45_16_T64]
MIIRKQKEKGFTLVELITVIALVSLLAIYLSVEMNDAGEDAKVAMASAFLLSNVPQAINSFRARHAGACDFDNLNVNEATDNLTDRGLFATTPWGDTWEANYNASARQITVSFPTTNAENPTAAAEDIAASAAGKPQVARASGGAADTADTILFSTATTVTTTDYLISCTAATDMACITYVCN